MSWQTNNSVLRLRTIGRSLGLNRIIAGLVGGKDYELKFQTAMLKAVQAGDTVWDVGANVGLYSRLFAEIAGSAGHVIAYEPSPANQVRLRDNVGSIHNIVVMPIALGERKGTAYLEQGNDALGATSQIKTEPEPEVDGRVAVHQESGDDLIASGAVDLPAVIKIDTEGCELDVLRGLSETLRNRNLRAVCVEVHFRLLKERGQQDAPLELERMLTSSGFHVTWPDASHIVATRIRV